MRRVLFYVPVCVCLGDEKWQLFSLCSNSSFHLLGFFVFLFQAFERSFFGTHLDFPVSIVASRRILEQSFCLSFFLSLYLFFFLSLCVCLYECGCVYFSSSFLFLSLILSLSPFSVSLSLSLCLLLYFSLLKFNDQENQLSK